MTQRNRPEHDEERNQIIPFYSGLGIEVFATSARVWAKGVTPGVPDLICFSERLGFHFFHETKLPPNRQTDDQHKFERSCLVTNTPYVLGGILEAMSFVVFLGVADQVGPTIRVRPRASWPHSDSFIEIGNEWARHNDRVIAVAKYGFKRVA